MQKTLHIYLLIGLIFLLPPILSAQAVLKQGNPTTAEHDSLPASLASEQDLLAQIRTANDLAQWHMQETKEGGEEYIRRSFRLFDLLAHSSKQAYSEPDLNYEKCRAMSYKSVAAFSRRDLHSCYYSWLQIDSIASIELPRSSKDRLSQYRLWKNESMQSRAYISFVWGYTEKAFALLNEALMDAQRLGSQEWVGKAQKKMAEMYAFLGSSERAVKTYREAIRHLEKDKLSSLVANSYVALGNLHTNQGEIRLAVTAYEKGIDHFKSLGNTAGVAAAYFNMAQVYQQVGDYEYAARHARTAMKYYQQLGKTIDVADCIDILISTAYRKNDYMAVIDYAVEALRIRTDAGDKVGALISNDILIFAYLSTSHYLKEFDSHDYYAHQAHIFSEKTVMSSLGSLSRLKDFSLLTAYLEADSLKVDMRQFAHVKDSLLLFQAGQLRPTQNNQNLASKLTRFETESQKHTIELQDARIQAAKTRFWVVVFSLVITAILAYFIYVSARQQKDTNIILKQRNLQIEEQQKKINEQMKETQSLMGFKERMTNMIIHDLKTPLNGIVSAEYIADENLKSEIVRHSAHEMMSLVQNVLDFYKSQETGLSINTRLVDLVSIVEGEIRNIRFILEEKKLRLNFLHEQLPKFYADPQLLRRVIGNIFSNAAKYSPQRSEITLRAQVENQTDIHLYIANQGPSIPEEQMDLIFQPFGQAGGGKSLGKISSTGLGLTFCQLAVEAHGGKIGVTPNKIEGAEFWIKLPNCIKLE